MNNNYKQLKFDSDIYNTIRKNIRYYRKEKGMTSAELADLTELSHDFIRQLQSNSKKHIIFLLKPFIKFPLR